MIQSHLGEIAALITAICWTVTALAFYKAVNSVGTVIVNFLKLFIGLFFLTGMSYFARGVFFPFDAGMHQWIWLSVSALIGFVIGDYFLFKSFIYIEARITMLIMALSPPFAAVMGWLLMDEQLSFQSLIAMSITLAGIIIVVLHKKTNGKNSKKKIAFNYSITGLLLALGGSLGQAGGLVLSKYGMEDYNVIAATQIRVIVGFVSFGAIVAISRKWKTLWLTVKNKKVINSISLGAIFGPFLGVYFSLLSVQHTSTGIASSIMSIVPILIIPPAIFFFKEKITLKEIAGSFITVIGVAFFFLDIPFLN